jgi:L-asparaginase II
VDNPVLVEVTRGPVVESRHRGSIAVVDAEGALVLALGDIDRPVFPRSAVKALQALPLIENGFAEKYGLTDQEIALACASHGGEEPHVAAARAMLAKAGQGPGCLECGVQWPSFEAAKRDLVRRGEVATALNNNCSGKHAGFICLACGLDEDPAGYIKPGHKVQAAVRAAMIETTGDPHDPAHAGTDGCSIPSYAVPLRALALGFARLGTGHGFGPERTAAAKRIRDAVAAHPFYVAGTGRFDTVMMEALGARVFMKTGAEGAYCAAIPELGFGIALKADDGAGRAAEVMMASMVARLLQLGEAEQTVVARHAAPVLKNWNGIEVGILRGTAALA